MGLGRTEFPTKDRRTYAEKLQDPRWLAKRATILSQRDDRCELCSKTGRLEVHHGYYRPAADPWDYESSTLWCLCRSCHDSTQKKLTHIHRQVGKVHPKDLDDFIIKCGDAVSETIYGMTQGEIDHILSEMRETEAKLYHEYRIDFLFSNELGPTRIDEVEKNAVERFPGIEVTTTEHSGRRDCIGTVVGPDVQVCATIQNWLEKQAN